MATPSLKPDEPEFSIDTIALDRIDAFPLTIGRMSEIEKKGSDTSTSFMNVLISIVGRGSTGEELSEDEVAKLSDADRDRFAQKVLEFNPYLFRERVRESRKDEDGRVVLSFRDGDVKHQREEDESESDYLFRLFKIQTDELKKHARRVLGPVEDMLKANKRLFTPSFLEAIQRSQSSAAQLGNMIDRLRIKVPDVSGGSAAADALKRIETPEVYRPELRVPDLSNFRSPLLDTNERLSDVLMKLDAMEGLALQMAETVRHVSETASQFIVDFGVATEKADRSSRRATWIAVSAIAVATVLTIVQIGYSEWRTQQEQGHTASAINAISARIEVSAKAQRESMEEMGSKLNSDSIALKSSLDRLSIAAQKLAEVLRMPEKVGNSSGSEGRIIPAE